MSPELNPSARAPARLVLVLAASTRPDGNAEQLARTAISALPAEVPVRWLHLARVVLPPFEDIRHAGSGAYPPPAGDLAQALDALLWATDVVIATPVYWYSMPATLKLFLDHWSGFLRVPSLDFKARMAGKAMHVLCATSSGDTPAFTQPLLDSLRYSAEYMGMRWAGAVVGDGSKPGDVLNDTHAIAAAARLLVA